MKPRKFALTILLFLAACDTGSGGDGQSAGTDAPANGTLADQPPIAWREEQYARGRELFEAHCARCHVGGEDGAPAVGDRETWSNRSLLWSAVLFEHAKQGYMEMPAKGGAELSDHEVELAGEYMLSETFPELPRD